MNETTPEDLSSPKKIESPIASAESPAEESVAIQEEDICTLMRERLQPLYDSVSLLGFAVCDHDGQVLKNDSFLSHEGVSKAARTFLSNCEQMSASDRHVHRLTVEMNDVIVIFHRLQQGQGMFILSSDCDIDAAADLIAQVAS